MKNVLIAVLTIALIGMTWLALRNCVPVCDDLVRYPADTSHQLVCEYGLGDVQEDSVNVRMRERL